MRIRSQVWARFVEIEGCAGIVVVSRYASPPDYWRGAVPDTCLRESRLSG
jgi:hypothetical protein